MDKEMLKKAIEDKLEIINEQFGIIRNHSEKIPLIELDLLKENIRNIYELLLELEKENRPEIYFSLESNTQPESEKLKTIPETQTKPEPVQESEPESEHESEPEPEPEPKPEPEPVVMQPEYKKPEIQKAEEFSKKEEKAPEPEKKPEATHRFSMNLSEETAPDPNMPERNVPGISIQETTQQEPRQAAEDPKNDKNENENHEKAKLTTLDLFNEPSSTLADKLKDHTEKSIAEKLKENRVHDLKSHIGINEKFLFINELFDGNLRSYEESINRLNNCAAVSQAELILTELRLTHNWDMEENTARAFVDLIRRKF